MKAHRPGELLLVDADRKSRALFAAILQQRGHAVRVCGSAAETRDYLQRFATDAVLCGRNLTDSTGEELCAWIKSHEDLQGIPVALVRGAGASVDEAPEDEAGPLAPDEIIVLPLADEEFGVRVTGLLKLRRYREEIGNALAALMAVAEGAEEQDPRSQGHCRRLAIMSVLLGAALGCNEYELLALERAGFLHDIGKTRIPGAILEKSQPLTPRELQIVRQHPILGEKLCAPVVALRATLPIIRHHHERGDGSGYPDRLRLTQIPRLVQIFSIVDVYESLRSWRPYRPLMTNWQALGVLQQEVENGLWNGEILRTFTERVVPLLDEQLDASGVGWPTANSIEVESD